MIENCPGAATNLATQAVVRAEADGYTLLTTTTTSSTERCTTTCDSSIRDRSRRRHHQQPLVFVVTPALGTTRSD